VGSAGTLSERLSLDPALLGLFDALPEGDGTNPGRTFINRDNADTHLANTVLAPSEAGSCLQSCHNVDVCLGAILELDVDGESVTCILLGELGAVVDAAPGSVQLSVARMGALADLTTSMSTSTTTTAAAGISSPAAAPTTPEEATVALVIAADATLYEETDASAQLANGGGSRLFAGANGNGLVRRTLLRADLSSLPRDIEVGALFLLVGSV
jgi:hypothetical protein